MSSTRIQRALLALCVVNLALVIWLLVQVRGIRRTTDGTVLRGKALQIVDEAGRVRASISVLPENEKYRTAEGGPWPETVLLRLINEKGGPAVKLSATARGSGLLLGGGGDPTYIQIKSDLGDTAIKMINHDGKETVIKP